MLNNLQEHLGLTQNESKVYGALIKGVRLDPTELATETGLPRTRIYEVLSSLAAKNLVEKRSHGNGYRLIPPKKSIPDFITNLQKEYNNKIATIEEFGSYLDEVWHDNLASQMSPGVEILPLEDAEPLFIEQLKSVERRVWIAAADTKASIDMRKSGSTLASAYNPALDVRYLMTDEEVANRVRSAFNHFEPFQKMKIEIKTNNKLSASFVILDNIIYVFFFGGTDTLEPTAMRTSSKQLVESFEYIYTNLWSEVT